MLHIENLSIQAGEKRLVKELSLDVLKGEIVALVGESGSGKSLSCLSILSLLPETIQKQGKIIFTSRDGHVTDISSMDADMRSSFALKHIAYVFQEPLTALNPVQTCGKQLFENLSLCGYTDSVKRKEKAMQLLTQVELHDTEKVLSSYPFQLSGGQRQRVMIAMALAGDPDCIIADEPTTALDVVIQDEILGLLKKLCREEERSVLLVSHDIDAVERYADRIAVMYKGEIVETGTANSIIQSPQHPYTKALLACKPSPEKKGLYLNTLQDMLEGKSLSKKFADEVLQEEVLADVKSISKTFTTDGKAYKALDDISFIIRKGSSTGLIGESGSGKSTISKLLVKLEKAEQGEIGFDFKNKKPLSSNVQMIFQDPFAALNPALSVQHMLEEVIQHHDASLSKKERMETAVHLLTKVGLQADDLKKYPSEFSGGQRQRLCIARALAARPLLLICDESTSALDLSVQAQILNLLKELQLSEQLSILMVTHSMAVAAWFCNYLIVLKNGRIVEQGVCETLMQDAQHPYTKTMLAHA